MTEYLITFNDEWVPDHTEQQLREKAAAARVVLDEMRAADVVLFTNGGLDRSTAICSVESVDGKPLFTDGPYVETKDSGWRRRDMHIPRASVVCTCWPGDPGRGG